MSIASPTLRSSSTIVPLLSFKSSLTSIPDLPRTADTVTGTSKTASRSAELRLGSPSCAPWVCRSAVLSPALSSRARSGNSTSSLFAMSGSFVVTVPEIAGDQFLQSAFYRGRSAFRPAAAPFDAAVRACQRRIRGNLHAAFEAILMRDLVRADAELFRNRRRRLEHEARLSDCLMHGFAQCRFDLGVGK